MRRFITGLLAVALILPITWAKDVVIVNRPESGADRREEFSNQMLGEALRRTENRYGPYELRYADYLMERGKLVRKGDLQVPVFRSDNDRILYEMRRGEIINVSMQPTREEWERELIPVRIPVDKGLFSYRIFLIRVEDQPKFSAIRNLEELKRLQAGVGDVWSIYQVLKLTGFETVAGSGYEALFEMLQNKRFDYFPRALHEAPLELRDRKGKFPDIVIEKDLAFFVPQPRYFFVSPARPKLARRIEEGFNLMLKDGSFDRMLVNYYRPLIEETGFCKRRVFNFDNPVLPKETPLQRKVLWLDPKKPVKGGKPLCP